MMLTLRVFALALLGVASGADVSPTPAFLIEPDNTFTQGRLYYRTLHLDADSSSLYVGAMNHVFRLWMYNVNDTDQRTFFAHKELGPAADDLAECSRYSNRNPEYHCQNHIRLVFRLKKEDTLFICSSNAYKPVVTRLNPTTFASLELSQSMIGICSGDPDLNTTAVYVESGNPGEIASVYSGIRTGLALENHLIYRPPLTENGREKYPSLRTMFTDSKWLDEPHFVQSFDIGSYVYFFFREAAVEFENCGRATYSRVARICKNDLGGKNVLRQVWATYLKARLNCSLPGEFPFYFDQLQSVYKLDSKSVSDTIFYATFSNGQNEFSGSAVCSFSLRDIDNVFDRGVFKEQVSSTAAWLPTLPEQVPSPRPGACVEDTRELSDSALHFTKSHMLMDEAVAPLGGRPLFVKRDLMLTQVVVDVESPSHGSYHIIFAGSTEGDIYKIVQWAETSDGGAQQSRLLAIYRLPSRTPIRAMQILKNEFIYVGQDTVISQLNTAQCDRYGGCAACTADPYCSWNNPRQQCFKRDDAHMDAAGWIPARPDRHEQTMALCDTRPRLETRILYPGDSVHLQCRHESRAGPVVWQKDNSTVDLSTGHLLLTVDGGIVIVNATIGDSGLYGCSSQGQIVVLYKLFIDDANCQKPTSLQQFQTVYREWCREFQNYKTTMSKWQQWYQQNSHCANAPNFKISSGAEQKKTNRISNHIGQEE